jgi:hypothetical protein
MVSVSAVKLLPGLTRRSKKVLTPVGEVGPGFAP